MIRLRRIAIDIKKTKIKLLFNIKYFLFNGYPSALELQPPDVCHGDSRRENAPSYALLGNHAPSCVGAA